MKKRNYPYNRSIGNCAGCGEKRDLHGNKKCSKCYQRDYIKRNPEKEKQWQQNRSEKRKQKRRKLKERLVKRFGGKCEKCGYNKCIRALVFHHKDPEKKENIISKMTWMDNYKKLLSECKKCKLLCANCHAEEDIDT